MGSFNGGGVTLRERSTYVRTKYLSVAAGAALAVSLTLPLTSAFAAGNGSGGGGGGSGGSGGTGETETLGNNLSVPTLFVPGPTATGAPALRVACDGAIHAPEGPQTDGYWLQGTDATWSSYCNTAEAATVTAQWGDNLVGTAAKADKPNRVEISLLDMTAINAPYEGYVVTNLTPDAEDRYATYGTDGTAFTSGVDGPAVDVWGPDATLNITNKDTHTVIYDGPITAEINATGGVVYGFNWGGADTGTVDPAGTYDLTFTIGTGVTIDAASAGTFTANSAVLEVTLGASSGSGGSGSTGISFTSASSTTWSVNQPGSFTVTATGSPTPTLTKTGALPSGVTFVDNGNGTATLSGTPTTSGSYPLTFTASSGSSTVNQDFTLAVLSSSGGGSGGGSGGTIGVGFASGSHATFPTGQHSSFTVIAIGSPVPKLTESGALPSGVSFTDNGDGTATLSGTPAAGTAGDFPLSISASNGIVSATQDFTLSVVSMAANQGGGNSGNWLVTSDGHVYAFGNAMGHGSMGGQSLNEPIVGMAKDQVTGGYWLVASDGGVFAFDASYYGSMGGRTLDEPVVGIAGDPATGGYWLVAKDGGVFAFNAPYFGSMSGRPLNAPIVGIAAAANGQGYNLVAADGGVFSFGGATFYGSMGNTHLTQPIVGMAGDTATGGYWLVAADGGVFAFNAPFQGSMGGQHLTQPITGMGVDSTTGGYWLVAADGGVFAFNTPFVGSMGGQGSHTSFVGMAGAS